MAPVNQASLRSEGPMCIKKVKSSDFVNLAFGVAMIGVIRGAAIGGCVRAILCFDKYSGNV